MGPNNVLSKTYKASGAITKGRLLQYTASNEVAHAAGVTSLVAGVAMHDAASGENVSVAKMGLVTVKIGGTVAVGAALTSNASGLAVAAAPSAGVNNQIAGFAEEAGVANDEINMWIARSVMQGA